MSLHETKTDFGMNMRHSLPPWIVFGSLVLIVLNLIDTVCTLYHINRGVIEVRVIEVNPLVNMLLKRGVSYFVVTKYFLLACGIVGIAAGVHHPWSKKAIQILVVFYGLVVVWHGIIFWRLSMF